MLKIEFFCLILLLLVIMPTMVLAWDNCPFGEINDPYPGHCTRYVDTDSDAICDYSQSAPEDRNNSVVDEDIKSNVNQVNLEPINDKDVVTLTTIDKEIATSENQEKRVYHLLPIVLILTIFYVISHILLNNKTLSIMNFRRIWNVLLLFSFIISGATGILLIISINYNIVFTLPFNMLFWHVEIGIFMFVICVFHIIERRAFFYNMLKGKKK